MSNALRSDSGASEVVKCHSESPGSHNNHDFNGFHSNVINSTERLEMSEEQKEQKAKPVKTFRLGANEAAVWKRETEKGTFFDVSLSRSYKKADDSWGHTGFFKRDDLLVVGKLCDQAHTWVHSQRANGSA